MKKPILQSKYNIDTESLPKYNSPMKASIESSSNLFTFNNDFNNTENDNLTLNPGECLRNKLNSINRITKKNAGVLMKPGVSMNISSFTNNPIDERSVIKGKIENSDYENIKDEEKMNENDNFRNNSDNVLGQEIQKNMYNNNLNEDLKTKIDLLEKELISRNESEIQLRKRIVELENEVKYNLNMIKRYKETIDLLKKNEVNKNREISELSQTIINYKKMLESDQYEIDVHFPEDISYFFSKIVNYMQGKSNEESLERLSYEEIQKFIPHIEKFVLDLGNNFVNLEEKFVFVENNNIEMKNLLSSESLKLRKAHETANDIKAENKFLK